MTVNFCQTRSDLVETVRMQQVVSYQLYRGYNVCELADAQVVFEYILLQGPAGAKRHN